VLVQLLVEPLEAFSVFGHRTDILLEHALLRRGRADDLREPPEMGRTPIGSAGVADSMSEQKGFAAKLGILQLPGAESRKLRASRCRFATSIRTV